MTGLAAAVCVHLEWPMVEILHVCEPLVGAHPEDTTEP